MKLFIYAVILVGTMFALRYLRNTPSSPAVNHLPEVTTNRFDTVLKNLEIPWEIVFLPDGNALITERPGKVLFVSEQAEQAIPVVKIGEGGLLGMTIHPQFASNRYVYLYFTYKDQTGLFNKVERYTFEGKTLHEDKTIIDKIPASTNHDGGRIKFGPDGKLYITTGETQKPELAQDLTNLGGKILRINDDGTIPVDNPFTDSAVYSYGHRNPQGLAWDALGNLWETEHGENAKDEINLIKPAKNYGWPVIRGDEKKDGYETPFANSGDDTWAPSGATVLNNKLYFVGLAGRSVYVLDLATKKLNTFFQGELGRLRSINLGPDGKFYLITSNLDGRNKDPDPEDDRLLRINQFPSE